MLKYDKIDYADYLEKSRLEPDPLPMPHFSKVWNDDPAYRGENYHDSIDIKKRRKKLKKLKKRR